MLMKNSNSFVSLWNIKMTLHCGNFEIKPCLIIKFKLNNYKDFLIIARFNKFRHKSNCGPDRKLQFTLFLEIS